MCPSPQRVNTINSTSCVPFSRNFHIIIRFLVIKFISLLFLIRFLHSAQNCYPNQHRKELACIHCFELIQVNCMLTLSKCAHSIRFNIRTLLQIVLNNERRGPISGAQQKKKQVKVYSPSIVL